MDAVAFILAFLGGAALVSLYFGVEHVKKTLAIKKLRKKLAQYEHTEFSRPGSATDPYHAPAISPHHD